MASRLTRREFVGRVAAASTLFAVPEIIPSRAFGANERIITGHIGVGGQGNSNLGAFLANAAAVCDVDSKRAAAAGKRVQEKNGACEVFADYRRLLDRKEIDAVVISTPDHWHALQTIHACQAGKDVYVEKPLTLTIAEGRKMVEAARQNKRIVQTGSQQRSSENFRQACELVRNGAVGKVKTVLVGIPLPNYPKDQVPDSDPPAELDYNFWLGPAPWRPYNAKRVHYNFRFFWDYSGGQMTNFGAHHIDIAQWGLGMDDSGPASVEGEASFNMQKLHEVTETCRLNYTYANGVKMIVGQGQKDIPDGTTFIGDTGEIHVTRGSLKSKPEELLRTPVGENEVRLYASTNHHQNFLQCIASRELPICDVEIGHRTATACHLGNLAARLGRKIEWDPEKEQIVGDNEAAAMVERSYREPWKLDS
jgi:predicted dehydrogenase